MQPIPRSGPAFGLFRIRTQFRAAEPVYFPAGKTGNMIRGAFGTILRQICCAPDCPGALECPRKGACPYARIFEPGAYGKGPSGLANWPRPFVFRAAHLDGQTVRPGETFHFDVHLFDLREPAMQYFVLTFRELLHTGLGPGRAKAELTSVYQIGFDDRSLTTLYDGFVLNTTANPEPSRISLEPGDSPVRRVQVEFVTPTELKFESRPVERPEFGVLFGRVRDRIATLNTLYGDGSLPIDFKGLGERAGKIRMTRSNILHIDVERKSSRTGQRHPVGGFTGSAEYEGDLAEFLPFLRCAMYVGVGRHTTFGNGEIRVS